MPEESIVSPPLASSKREQHEVAIKRKSPNSYSLYKNRYFDDIELAVTRHSYKTEKHAENGQIKEQADTDLSHIGPPGANVTWRALSTLVTMAVSYAIPANRLSKMLANDFKSFCSSQVTRLLRRVSILCVPIYLELVDQLAEVTRLNGDDSTTKVIAMYREEECDDDLVRRINERLGRVSIKADGSAMKKRLCISTVTGQTEASDARSWIFLFRTHFGDLGNLLSKILSSRRRKNRHVKIQTDLAAVNKLEKRLTECFEVTKAGCGAHARRPFWSHRSDDPGFCYFMLRGFALLARVERRLQQKGASPNEIIHYRRRYSLRIWSILLDRCMQVTGKIPRHGEGLNLNLWPKTSSIHGAAAYIIKNYQELTAYFDHPEIFFTNNLCERLLRREKMMLVSSKFRKTERGRIGFDVLQTICATCNAAGVTLESYLKFLWKNKSDLEENPYLYTPYAFAKSMDRRSSQEQKVS